MKGFTASVLVHTASCVSAESQSARQEISYRLCIMKVHHRGNKTPLADRTWETWSPWDMFRYSPFNIILFRVSFPRGFPVKLNLLNKELRYFVAMETAVSAFVMVTLACCGFCKTKAEHKDNDVFDWLIVRLFKVDVSIA
jgi:hypothetical protein